MTPTVLTDGQERVLRAIAALLDSNPTGPPSTREVALQAGYASHSTVRYHLRRLAANGWIRLGLPRRSRDPLSVEVLHPIPEV